MKIFLVRHGQSRWQTTRDDSDWNSPLTNLGQQQAALLADWLVNHQALDVDSRVEIGSIRVSPLLRAQETAVAINSALTLPITTDNNLQEADFFVSEHLPIQKSPYQVHPNYTPPTLYADFKEQVNMALNSLIAEAEASAKPVLAVAHGDLISTLLRTAVGSDAISFWLYNTTLNLIEWKRGRWRLVYFNLWDHLPPLLRTY